MTPARAPRIPRIVWIPVALIAAGAILVLATRPLGGGQPDPSFYAVRSPAPGIQVGEVAPGSANAPEDPSLVLTDLDGNPVSLADYDGQPLWIIFWRADCEPCLEEDPAVEAAYAAHQADGLAVLGIDAEDSVEVAAEYLARQPVGYPVAVDPGTAWRVTYGIWGEPTHYFLTPDGVIQVRYFGPLTTDEIERDLDRIL